MKYSLAKIIIIGLAFFYGLTSCKKDNLNPDPGIKSIDCYSGIIPENNKTYSNDFIIVFHKKSKLLQSNSGSRLLSASHELLQRNNIKASAFIDTYDGFRKGLFCKLSSEQLNQLKNDPDIDFIEQDKTFHINTCINIVNVNSLDWGVKRVGYADGSGKTAWIIDTGIDIKHDDLNIDTIASRSFINDETSIQDMIGHGTHVAGIIGAKNNNIGTVGVASGARIVSLKVLNQLGQGKISTVLKALVYIRQFSKRGDVVNMSLVSDSIFQSLDNEVTDIANQGILFAIASGNGGKDASKISPCRVSHPNVFVVSSMDSTDTWSSFSNYGSVVKLVAPGSNIRSTSLNNGYAVMSGTSMAAPHLAGLLLLDGRNFALNGTVKLAPDIFSYPIPHKK